MVGEFLLDIVFGIVTSILDSFSLSDITWSLDEGILSYLFDFVDIICYFLPLDTIMTIIGLVFSLTVFRAVIRLIITIWDLLPIA